jgi:hypothetical protein
MWWGSTLRATSFQICIRLQSQSAAAIAATHIHKSLHANFQGDAKISTSSILGKPDAL